MERKDQEVVTEEETPESPGPRFTEAQRGNLTRLIKGSRFSVVGPDIAVKKITGKPIG